MRYFILIITLFLSIHSTHGAEKRDLSEVSIFTPDHTWRIAVFPDGSVIASYGSNPEHQIAMLAGSVDFKKLARDVKAVITDKIVEGGTQVALRKQGETTSKSSYLTRDQFLRKLFPNKPNSWRQVIPKLQKDMNPDIEARPISDEMVKFLRKHPIYL